MSDNDLRAVLAIAERIGAGDSDFARHAREALDRERRRPPRERRVLELLERAEWPALEEAYEALRPIEQQVLDLRYGLDPRAPERLTQNAAAQRLDRSRSWVGEVEARALKKLASRIGPKR